MPEMRERALRKGPGNSGVLRSGGACSEGGTALTEASARLLAASAFLWTAAVPDLRTKKIPLWIPAVFLPAALAADLFLCLAFSIMQCYDLINLVTYPENRIQ